MATLADPLANFASRHAHALSLEILAKFANSRDGLLDGLRRAGMDWRQFGDGASVPCDEHFFTRGDTIDQLRQVSLGFK